MQAANVLMDDDVAVVDELLVDYRQHVDDRQTRGSLRAEFRIVGRAEQQDGRVGDALLHDDDRIELGPIAHRHHGHALDEIGLRKDFVIAGDDVRSHRGNLLRRDRFGG